MDFTTAASIKRTLYLLIIVAAVLFVTHAELLTQPIWFIFACFSLVQTSLAEGLFKRTFMLIMSGFIAAVFVIAGGLVAANIYLSVAFLLIVTALCTYREFKDEAFGYPLLIVNMIAVLALYQADSPAGGWQRALAVADAVIIVVAAQTVLLPFFARSEYNRTRKITFFHLRNYVQALFECLTSPDYPDDVYYYERELHKEKIKCMHGITTLATMEQKHGFVDKVFNAGQIQNIFAVLVDVSQIRRRSTDHTAFALCAPELLNLEDAMVQLFTACASQFTSKLEHICEVLEARILQLDDNLENVVKIASREPAVFVLFRTALQGLYEDMSQACASLRAEGA